MCVCVCVCVLFADDAVGQRSASAQASAHVGANKSHPVVSSASVLMIYKAHTNNYNIQIYQKLTQPPYSRGKQEATRKKASRSPDWLNLQGHLCYHFPSHPEVRLIRISPLIRWMKRVQTAWFDWDFLLGEGKLLSRPCTLRSPLDQDRAIGKSHTTVAESEVAKLWDG